MDKFNPKDVVKVVQDYSGYINAACRKYYIVGGTPEDLYQEGVIGLLEACKNYKGESLFEPKFDAFAKKCIHRQIIDSIRHSNTLKNKALNEQGVEFIYPDTKPFQNAVMPLHKNFLSENPDIGHVYNSIQQINVKHLLEKQ